ncbi:aconitate hydratase AcnA [Halioxenophilus aromaticivorans]|uniref:Aconitate hydratase n=1 Tax=Halioxenophilus aromaticivorans TaxID=1306992 RepID=A0AAV3TY15_9ALTE
MKTQFKGKKDSFAACQELLVNNKSHTYFRLDSVQDQLGAIKHLPRSLKVLLENLLRWEDGDTVTKDDIQAVVDWQKERRSSREIQYRPARVLMQDFTGVPAVVDLAAMRDAVVKAGVDASKINPLAPVDLVIDHSVMVDEFASPEAFAANVEKEMQRNKERYEFLRWGQKAFENFRVVPPGTGICHQVNLEFLGQVVWLNEVDDEALIYPDTLVGTDSHTTMINGLGILGWGVGGIEAEAAMLGQPVSMLIPEVVGFKFEGSLNEGVTATDLVLTVTEMLRAEGVVGKFVEFYGPGLAQLPLADRATIANMAPEYGATCGFFPVDDETLRYMQLSGRPAEVIARVEAYTKAQGLWHDPEVEPNFTATLSLDLSTVKPSLAGPKRPQDRVLLPELKNAFEELLALQLTPASNATANLENEGGSTDLPAVEFSMGGETHSITHGDVVIAAITSCTNTSNPSVMMAAGLLAKKAVEKGLLSKPWVKTSLAPGSKVVTDYLAAAGLMEPLEKLGFYLTGYGCTTCIGNSGPLPEPVADAIVEGNLTVSAVLSGNRNFEGRIHSLVQANWLASPPLVVAFALAGSTAVNLEAEPLAVVDGKPVFLADIWPTNKEIAEAVASVTRDMYQTRYADVFSGDDSWKALATTESDTYDWQPSSTYVRNPPYFDAIDKPIPPAQDIQGAKALAVFGDSITTDHISPAGTIKADSPAGLYLQENDVHPSDFNSYGSRRGNHEVMMRGTFANIRIKNQMLDGKEGGYGVYQPTGDVLSIYDVAQRYDQDDTDLIVLAGKEYGTGSSRDWAAKGTQLLGVKAVIAESFERIHRSNLVGFGVLPLQFAEGDSIESLGLTGTETFAIKGLAELQPQKSITVEATKDGGDSVTFIATCRIDTQNELEYYRSGGILHYVLRQLLGTDSEK